MKEILKFFEHILNSVDNGDDHSVPNVNPTEIFNEGWMTRLLVYQSIKEKLIIDGLICRLPIFSTVLNYKMRLSTKLCKRGFVTSFY
jgi:hypothetical protein